MKSKAEIKVKSKKYYEGNKEEIKAKSKKYYEDNKEEIKVKNKKYREGNKEEIKAKSKKYYEDNKAKSKKYREGNKEQIKARRGNYNKKYYEENKAELKAKSKKYYEENKAELKAKSKKYREENKAELKAKRGNYNKAYHKKYREENKEKLKQRNKVYYAKQQNKINQLGEEERELLRKEFNRKRRKKHALNREEDNRKLREYRKDNKKFKQWSDNWRAKNKDKINLRKRRNYANYPEIYIEWRLKNKDKIKERYEKNKDKYNKQRMEFYAIPKNRDMKKQRNRDYYNRNKNNEEFKERMKKANEKYKPKRKQYLEDNKEKCQEQNKKYWINHLARIKKKGMTFYKDFRKQQRIIANKHYLEKKDTAEFKLQQKEYRKNNWEYFKVDRILRKPTKILKLHSKDILKSSKISIKNFLNHIEKQFKGEMNWDNIHIDHIVPKSFISKNTNARIVALKRINCLENLQPLFPKDNLEKQGRMDYQPGQWELWEILCEKFPDIKVKEKQRKLTIYT